MTARKAATAMPSSCRSGFGCRLIPLRATPSLACRKPGVRWPIRCTGLVPLPYYFVWPRSGDNRCNLYREVSMRSRDEADRLARRAPHRRRPPHRKRAAILSIVEFFDAEEGQVWQIRRADGTTEVQVAADISQPR